MKKIFSLALLSLLLILVMSAVFILSSEKMRLYFDTVDTSFACSFVEVYEDSGRYLGRGTIRIHEIVEDKPIIMYFRRQTNNNVFCYD